MTSNQVNEVVFMSVNSYLSADNCKGISIRDLEEIKENMIKLSRNLNISVAELILKNNWFLYEGEYYYFKRLYTAMAIVNELIGEYLSIYMDIPTIHYEIALDYDKVVGVLSKNFRDKNKKYMLALEIQPKQLKVFRDALEKKKITDLRRQLDKMLVRDFYSCLSDRIRNTLVSKSLFGQINLEVDFDYELSFVDRRECIEFKNGFDEDHEFDTYYNPLFRSDNQDEFMGITYGLLKEMIKYDEFLASQFDHIMGFNIGKCLSDIEARYNIKIAEELKSYYSYFDDMRKKELVHGVLK